MIGSRLGHYDVGPLLGEGGMGQVYRATDSRLNRDVALKVLPPSVADSSERAARFRREAQVLASMNHPNVAAIYGLEETGTSSALVMELVEGDTLADRLLEGPLPLDDVISIARQLAEGIEYAHEHGVIHRDLKPANIKITPSGVVKMLDFGLAKALDTTDSQSRSDVEPNSPTVTLPVTQAGLILGTAGYMSPEQAKGKPVDRRTDIWAFGVVVFEMLTGRPAYSGDTPSERMAHVITSDPDWAALPSGTPYRLRELLRRCLLKDQRQRLQSIGEARIALENVDGEEPPAGAEQAAKARRRELIWASLAVAGFLGVTAILLRERPAPPLDVLPTRFEITTPELGSPPFPQGSAVISPDGRKVAFMGMSGAKRVIWVHDLATAESKPVPNTENVVPAILVWSPDSRYLAFSTAGALRKVAVAGGPIQMICQLPPPLMLAAWGSSDAILLGGVGPLHRVSASGGALQKVGAPAGNEVQAYPNFLPDGRHYFFVTRQKEQTVAYLGDLETGQLRLLPDIESEVKYSSGHILFLRDGALVAQRFDMSRLEAMGEPFTVAQQVAPTSDVTGPFSVSDNGTVAFRLAQFGGETQFGWFDRSGKPLGRVGPIGFYDDIELSPDENLVVFETAGGIGPDRAGDIAVLDLARSVITRVTSDPARDADPVWSPDGRTIAFRGDRNGGHLHSRAYGVVGEDTELYKSEGRESPDHWSPDGRYVLYDSNGDIWALPMMGDRKPIQITSSPTAEDSPRVSPDGRWIAYQADEAGVTDVFVQSFPEPKLRQRVSTGGGRIPRWSADGKELFFLSIGLELMAVTVAASGPSLAFGVAKPLFPMKVSASEGNYAVSRTGRFLVNERLSSRSTQPITIILNWAAGLPR